MTFAWPAVLIALVAIPLAVGFYAAGQRRRARVAEMFTAPHMRPSIAPARPGVRRHLPYVAFGLAATILVLAGARPQHSVALPVSDGAVVLVGDTSASMASTDIAPSRLQASVRAARSFADSVPENIRVGVERFADRPVVVQSPTRERALVRSALRTVKATGHTAIGDAILVGLRTLTSLRSAGGRRIPGAMVLISDGTSTNGADPIAAAQQAASAHVPIYTVAVGTAHGSIPGSRGPNPVPLDDSELRRIAATAHAQSFTVGSARRLRAVYRSLAARIGTTHVKRELTAGFAGAGLLLLLAGAGLSLWLLRRLA